MQNGFGKPRGEAGVPEDLDLDNFLDSYLVQLQSDMSAPQQGIPPMQNMQQPLPGMAGLAGMQGNPMPGMAGMPGMSAGMAAPGQDLSLLGLLGNQPGGLNLAALQQAGLQQPGQMGHPMLNPYIGLQQQPGLPQQPGLAGLAGLNMQLAGSADMSGLAGLATSTPFLQPGMSFQQQAPVTAALPAAVQKPPAAPPATTATGRPRRAATAKNEPTETGTMGGGRGRGKQASVMQDDDSDAQSSDGSASSGEQPTKSRKKRELAAGGDNEEMSVAERRHLALQEKNRRAQRRFRERQKAKIADLHKQIEELTGKVGTLQTENAALHSRTSILEKVLDMRNEQIQVMQESKEISQHAEDAHDAPPLTLTAVSGQTISLTADMLKELTPEQIYKIYQTYIKELSARLVELNNGAPGAQEVTAQVEKLTKEVSFLLMRLSVVRPIETRKFITVSRQYLNTEAEAIDMWKNVVNSINLSEQQKMDIVQWKQLFMQKVEPIVEERKKLNVQIQAHLPQESFHTRNAITYIKTHEAVAKLRENLRAEHNVTIEFCAAVFKGVLNSFQMASLLVQAYPAVPDALAVASAVIADMHDKGQTLPATIANMPAFEGVNGLSVCPPMVCPPGAQDASQPTTAAAAAAAAAAAGVSQGAAIGLGQMGSHPSSLQQMQLGAGEGQRMIGPI